MQQPLHQDLVQQGWCRLPKSAALLSWAEAHLDAAQTGMKAPENHQWWRYQDTWFAGVNVLPNNELGAVAGQPPLPLPLLTTLADYCQAAVGELDLGQISALFPGYPQIDPQQSVAANQFRRRHYAAHLDGLVPLGPQRRRFLTEQHSFILGISLTSHPVNAAPLMIWPGSHKRIQAWLIANLSGLPTADWDQIDLTDGYQDIRKHILADTEPQALHLAKGEAYVMHRHLLHGMGHWPNSIADPHNQGRIIVYFRPCWHQPMQWLKGP